MADYEQTFAGNKKKGFTDLPDGTTAEQVTAALIGADGKLLNVGAPHCIAEVQIAALDTSDAGNDLATILGGTVLADAINGTTVGHVGFKLSFILMTVETQSVRVSLLSGNPAVTGQIFAKDTTKPHCIDVDDFTKIHITGNGGAAKVTFALFA